VAGAAPEAVDFDQKACTYQKRCACKCGPATRLSNLRLPVPPAQGWSGKGEEGADLWEWLSLLHQGATSPLTWTKDGRPVDEYPSSFASPQVRITHDFHPPSGVEVHFFGAANFCSAIRFGRTATNVVNTRLQLFLSPALSLPLSLSISHQIPSPVTILQILDFEKGGGRLVRTDGFIMPSHAASILERARVAVESGVGTRSLKNARASCTALHLESLTPSFCRKIASSACQAHHVRPFSVSCNRVTKSDFLHAAEIAVGIRVHVGKRGGATLMGRGEALRQQRRRGPPRACPDSATRQVLYTV
jgi:hypothetical protein